MIRALSAEPIPAEVINRLLDTARRAPSAGNSQGVTFVVLDRPELTRLYWNTTLPQPRRVSFRWQKLLDAPVLILVMTDPSRYTDRYRQPDKVTSGRTTIDDWPVPYWWVDTGAVIQNLLLLVTESGLGACLFGPFDHEPALIAAFDLPPGRRITATIAVGQTLEDEPGRSFHQARRPISEIIVRPKPS